MTRTTRKKTILIADDSEMNREILADILGEEYEIIEAENGAEAVSILQHHRTEIEMLLLDYVMPEMNGFEVLEMMNRQHWIEDIPVIMISAESSMTYVEQAYELGVVDFIKRPFEALVVQRRVANTMLLYAKQKKLTDMIIEQIYENEKQSSMMINILSHIVEFRNGESGQHVLHIHTLTELMLKHLITITDKYPLTSADIAMISTASALHDVGKISIPAEVINKPGRFTPEEFAVMKTHAAIGAEMLKQLPEEYADEPLVKTAYEICRWHHERYDGRGYPDALKGDEIPISAQIVALADVYDALTSERVYKKAFSHEVAVGMILEGQCGVFNPLLMRCLSDIAPTLREQLNSATEEGRMERRIEAISQEVLKRSELSISSHPLQLLERERMKYSFYRSIAGELWFEYTCTPPMLTLSPYGAHLMGTSEVIANPGRNEQLSSCIRPEELHKLSEKVRACTPENPTLECDLALRLEGDERERRVLMRTLWTEDEPPACVGSVGKVLDQGRTPQTQEIPEWMNTHDLATGLYNQNTAQLLIRDHIERGPTRSYGLALVWVDNYAVLNESYGGEFGSRLLRYVAERLRQGARGGDILAQMRDELFMVFFEYRRSAPIVGQWMLTTLRGSYEDIPLSLRIGMGYTEEGDLADFDALLAAAYRALGQVDSGESIRCIRVTEDPAIAPERPSEDCVVEPGKGIAVGRCTT